MLINNTEVKNAWSYTSTPTTPSWGGAQLKHRDNVTLPSGFTMMMMMFLIGVSIPSDRNVAQREAENKLIHKNLSIEVQRMWNMKCFVIPVNIGATAAVTKGLKTYL
jgi:hypothetical protein